MCYNARVETEGLETMMIRPVGSLSAASASNAAFNYMSASNSLMAMTRNPSFTSSSLQNEKRLNADMLNDSLVYKVSLLQSDSMKRAKDQNMKRTLDIFG